MSAYGRVPVPDRYPLVPPLPARITCRAVRPVLQPHHAGLRRQNRRHSESPSSEPSSESGFGQYFALYRTGFYLTELRPPLRSL